MVFVSGFGAPQRGLHIMKRRLLRDGYNVVLFSLHWQDFSGGIPDMARALGREILSLKKLAPSAPIHLVAHSAGGIVARFYVQVLGGSHYCETLTTLATPHHGTWLALLGFLSHLAVLWRCLIQLSPRSRLLRKLNGAPIPSDMRLVSIYSTDDIVCRSGSTRLPLEYAESPNVASFAIGGLSHSDFVLSKKGYQLIRTVLKSWGKGLPNDILAAINT
ncbi:MAG: hypothetical protein HYR96_13835 [Deltaproteobacteria bacterium]|nr:hypothetical protein [Deltaproteobacteria bacterium]